jgi:hypothetical protein
VGVHWAVWLAAIAWEAIVVLELCRVACVGGYERMMG